MEAWEVIDKAADEMGARGKSDDYYVNPANGSCCIFGALALAAIGADAECCGWWLDYDNYRDSWFPTAPRHVKRAVVAVRRALGHVHNYSAVHTASESAAMLRAIAASLKAARTEGTRQHVAESTDAKVGAENADALV